MDFAPISRIGSFTFMLLINPGVPLTSIAELITYAKANPGKLSYASGNTSGIVAGRPSSIGPGSKSFMSLIKPCRRR